VSEKAARKPRIFYIHGGGDVIGGIETYLARSVKHHKLFEPYIGVVKRGKVFEYIRETGFNNLIDLKGGKLKEIPKTVRAIYNAVRFIKEKKIELLVANGLHSWIYGGIIAKTSGIKSVFYVHADIKREDFKTFISGISLRIMPTLYIANSEFTAESIRRLLKRKTEVSTPASDIQKFDSIYEDEAKRKLREEFNIPENIFIFSIIGRIQRWKGQDTAIAAFKNMRHKEKTRLMIVGDVTFKSDLMFYNDLKDLSKKEKDGIIFTGFREDIPYIMKGSDVILNISRNPEPFGIVIVEGMMARKPVIATKQGGPLEIVKSSIDGFLVEPNDYIELAKLMDRLVEDQELVKKISENGYKKAKTKFTMQVSVERLEKILSGALSN